MIKKLITSLSLLMSMGISLSVKSQAKINLKTESQDLWIKNLREFRDAIYQNDRIKTKTFLNFPFNSNNDIWYLVYAKDEKSINKINNDLKKFTEKDFDKYFHEIFTKPFLRCFLQIKMDQLYKNTYAESSKIKESLSNYILYADFDKKNQEIVLNLLKKTPYKVSNKEYHETETSYIYNFKILKDGSIKLKSIYVAG